MNPPGIRIFETLFLLIKVTQIECGSDLRAPQGCTQWYYGSNTNSVRSFNFNDGSGIHLGEYAIIREYYYIVFNSANNTKFQCCSF